MQNVNDTYKQKNIMIMGTRLRMCALKEITMPILLEKINLFREVYFENTDTTIPTYK